MTDATRWKADLDDDYFRKQPGALKAPGKHRRERRTYAFLALVKARPALLVEPEFVLDLLNRGIADIDRSLDSHVRTTTAAAVRRVHRAKRPAAVKDAAIERLLRVTHPVGDGAQSQPFGDCTRAALEAMNAYDDDQVQAIAKKRPARAEAIRQLVRAERETGVPGITVRQAYVQGLFDWDAYCAA